MSNPSVSSYTFDNMSRIGLDDCCKSQSDLQNVSACNYTLQNYFASDCSMKKPIDLATTQPGIMYKGGFNVGAGGCNINDSSNLLIGTIQTHPRCRIDLFQRPFATVPYLGRGNVNPVIESQIQQGETIVNKKSVANLSEKSYIKYHQTPLLPSVMDKVTNPVNSVEEVAVDGWVRGGVPSRELTRDNDYHKKHTSKQYI
jgi:hypothetical protein